MIGVVGIGFTITFRLVTDDVQPAAMATTAYVPAWFAVAGFMIEFCVFDENELGPVQKWLLPPVEVKLIGFPAQTGEFPLAIGAAGMLLITTVCAATKDVQPDCTTNKL